MFQDMANHLPSYICLLSWNISYWTLDLYSLLLKPIVFSLTLLAIFILFLFFLYSFSNLSSMILIEYCAFFTAFKVHRNWATELLINITLFSYLAPFSFLYAPFILSLLSYLYLHIKNMDGFTILTFHIQFTQKQHGFELCGSYYMWIVFCLCCPWDTRPTPPPPPPPQPIQCEDNDDQGLYNNPLPLKE